MGRVTDLCQVCRPLPVTTPTQTNIGSQAEADDIMTRYSEYFDTKTLKMYVAGTRQQR